MTGGLGFIGSRLTRELVSRAESVRVVDDLSTGKLERLADIAADIDLIRADLATADLGPIVEGMDRVYHLAAVPSVPRSVRDPILSHASNATATLRLLVALRDRPVPVVLSSSSSVYGDTSVSPKREDLPPAPISPYAVAKLAAESYGRVIARLYRIPVVILRYFNVFGPQQDPASAYAAVIPRFVRAALDGRPLEIRGDGEQTRDFTYVDNVVQANIAAAEHGSADARVFNIAAGSPRSVLELVATLEGILGRRLERTCVPPSPGDIRHSAADITRARRELGWAPTVGFAEGLRRTVASFGG